MTAYLLSLLIWGLTLPIWGVIDNGMDSRNPEEIEAYLYDRTTGHFWFVPNTVEGIDSLLSISMEARDGQPEKSAYAAYQALEMAEFLNYEIGVATAHFALAEMYELFLDYPQALLEYQSALDVEKRLDRNVHIAQLLNRIGLVHIQQKGYASSRTYFDQAIQLIEDTGNEAIIAEALSSIGFSYCHTHNYRNALTYFERVKSIQASDPQVDKIKLSTLMYEANTRVELSEYEKAEELLLQAVQAFGEHEYIGEQSEGYLYLAALYRRWDQPETALDHTRAGMELAESVDYKPSVIKGYLLLADIYEDMDSPRRSLYYHKLSHELQNQVLDGSHQARLKQRQIQHKENHQRREIRLLQQQAALQEAELNNQKLLRIFLLGGLGLTIIIVTLLYRNIRIAKSAYALRMNLSQILEKSRNEIYMFDEISLKFIDVNVGARENLGYSLEELKNMTPLDIEPEFDPAKFRDLIQPLTDQTKNKIVYQTFHQRFDGSLYTVEVHLQLIPQNGNNVFVAFVIDITERLLLEDQLKISLKEKEILLNEVHHRVKNNLAIICSLLTLQASNVKDEQFRILLMESEGRVKTMSTIHEMLYQQEDFSRIAFGPYLKRLFSHISKSFKNPDMDIEFEVNARDINLDLSVAIPCGLIVNELLTNAYKHAFTGRDQGKITVNFTYEEGDYILRIKDNGKGYHYDEAEVNASMGMSLIHGLTKQINGCISIFNDNGTVVTISFKPKVSEPAGGYKVERPGDVALSS
ncbi:MAG: histidine kinase dimerization/phosphoacceptor domain -containing protein [Balneolales bacterium]